MTGCQAVNGTALQGVARRSYIYFKDAPSKKEGSRLSLFKLARLGVLPFWYPDCKKWTLTRLNLNTAAVSINHYVLMSVGVNFCELHNILESNTEIASDLKCFY